MSDVIRTSNPSIDTELLRNLMARVCNSYDAMLDVPPSSEPFQSARRTLIEAKQGWQSVIDAIEAQQANAPETFEQRRVKCPNCDWLFAQRSMAKPGMKEIVASVRLATDSELADFKEAIAFRDRLRAAQKAGEPRELTLHDFGYAPGNYSIKCLDCGQEALWCDKRAARCKTCAEQAMRENRTNAVSEGDGE